MGVFIRGWRSGRVTTHPTSVVVAEPATEPIDTTTAKLYARITDTAEDALIPTFIKAARIDVEKRTGLALITQTRDIYFDALPGDVFDLPPQSTPLQSVSFIKTTDTLGVVNTLDASNYTVDISSGRIALSEAGAWPTDLRAFQPWNIRIVAGYGNAAAVPAPLVRAVGLLTGFYLNEGRDRFLAKNLFDAYEEAIRPYTLVSV